MFKKKVWVLNPKLELIFLWVWQKVFYGKYCRYLSQKTSKATPNLCTMFLKYHFRILLQSSCSYTYEEHAQNLLFLKLIFTAKKEVLKLQRLSKHFRSERHQIANLSLYRFTHYLLSKAGLLIYYACHSKSIRLPFPITKKHCYFRNTFKSPWWFFLVMLRFSNWNKRYVL